jgi:hypothetical protein
VPSTKALSGGSERILRSVIAAIRPRGHGFDQPIDEDVLATIASILPDLPATARLGLPAGLRLLEWAPLFMGHPTRLTRMPIDSARVYLQGWLDSRFLPRHLLVYGLRALIFLSFYQHPTVQAAMGVRWGERLVETVQLRADTLDHAKYGYGRDR